MKRLSSKKTSLNIQLKQVCLKGNLTVPSNAKGLVLFSHGSGSSRLSPRNNYVARILQEAGLATLLFDLLTEQEDRVYAARFDIPRLTQRLIEVTRWIKESGMCQGLDIAYFGASTGAASALGAAAYFGPDIMAVVSRGGRPDLAMDVLEKVVSPTLLIVGGDDQGVIGLNEAAYDRLSGVKKLEIIPGASHLFTEAGKLDTVARLSASWFVNHFTSKTEKYV